jgi:hypothetical protein
MHQDHVSHMRGEITLDQLRSGGGAGAGAGRNYVNVPGTPERRPRVGVPGSAPPAVARSPATPRVHRDPR